MILTIVEKVTRPQRKSKFVDEKPTTRQWLTNSILIHSCNWESILLANKRFINFPAKTERYVVRNLILAEIFNLPRRHSFSCSQPKRGGKNIYNGDYKFWLRFLPEYRAGLWSLPHWVRFWVTRLVDAPCKLYSFITKWPFNGVTYFIQAQTSSPSLSSGTLII